MSTKINVLDQIISHPVIPVYYNDDPATCLEIMKACYHGGVRVFEFTNRGAKARDNFQFLQEERNKSFPDLLLGIGTIKTVEQAIDFIKLKTDFIVSPIVTKELAEVTKNNQAFWIPGCMTPTEIALAESLEVALVKLFPGDILGTGFLKAIKPLFPNLRFMPTGGVDIEKENITGWLQAGVSAMGFGSKLFNAPAESENYEWLTKRCQQINDIVLSGI